MRKGDKLICKETVNNVFGMPLFEKGINISSFRDSKLNKILK